MLKNYFLVARRHLGQHKGYSLINTIGLGIGVCCVLLIALYVSHEFSYDQFHERSERIYRVVVDRLYEDGQIRQMASTSPPLAQGIERSVPQVEDAVRVFVPQNTTGQVLLRHEDHSFFEKRFFYADPEIFDVFSFSFVRGDYQGVLNELNSIVLSESMAQKYFGGDDPIGQALVLDDSLTLQVTGVVRDLPSRTHLKMDFIAPYALLEKQYGYRASGLWLWDLVHTYVLIHQGANSENVGNNIQAYLDEHVLPISSRRKFRYEAALQPITRIHLYSDREWELEPGGNPFYLYLLSAIGVFVLLIAGINFVNLSTAMASRRAREVGLRKVLGGQRQQLITQFLCESLLVSFIATLLGVLIAFFVLPTFKAIAGIELSMQDVPMVGLGVILPILIIVIGLAAGSFSAFYLSSLRPIVTLRGNFKIEGGALRRALVVTQFVLSILAICATAVVYEQLKFMRGEELGFDKEQVLVLTTGRLEEGQSQLLKDELLGHVNIDRVTAASGLPGGQVEKMHVAPEGNDETIPVQMLWVDHDFVETLGIEIAEGRDFSETFSTDATAAYLINEEAVKAFNFANPLSKSLTWKYAGGQREGVVVGVVEDFHSASLREKISPLVLLINPVQRYLAVRIQRGDYQGVLSFVEEKWKTIVPDRPLEASFLDSNFDALYDNEERQTRLFASFAIFAIVIACTGLFGLAAFTVSQRRKEIGIRKVLGATLVHVLVLLSREYVKLVFIASILAIPIAYLAASKWLTQFAFHTSLGIGIFFLVGVAVLGLALAAVAYHSIKTALSDPVESLRYE